MTTNPSPPSSAPTDDLDALTHTILGAAIAVHRELGPGLLESAYEACLAIELESRSLHIARQVALPATYRGIRLDHAYRVDMIVEHRIIVELKAIDALLPVHEAQLLSYLKLSGKPVGLLINFHSVLLKDGVRRLTL